MNDNTTSYPKIPARQWQQLRKIFRRTIPKTVAVTYLANALTLKESSARVYLSSLRTTGLIDDNLEPTELANRWRHDDQYKEVCETMLTSVYPQELRDLQSGPDADAGKVRDWFMQYRQIGEGAARQMATFYVMLCQADPAEPEANGNQKEVGKKEKSSRPAKSGPAKTASGANVPNLTEHANVSVAPQDVGDRERVHGRTPSLHIDIQVHISPESTAEQIDHIFASMAKHLFARKTE